MRLFSKMLIAAAAVSGSALFGAEVIDLTAKDLWPPAKNVEFSAGKIVTNGRVMLRSKKMIAIDPAKKYTFKMNMVAPGAKKASVVLFGIYPANAKGALLNANRFQCNPKTFTQVVEAAPKGAASIKVKNGAAWNFKSKFTAIAVNAKADNSDIPNSNIISNSIKEVKKEGDVWVLTLHRPLTRAIAANTNIRQHFDGGYFYFGTYYSLKDKPVTLTKTVTGKSPVGHYAPTKGFYPGMTHGYLVMLIDWYNSKNKIEFKDTTFTIE